MFVDKLLKDRGYKITQARIAILEILSKSEVPLSVEGVLALLKKDKKNRGVNEATVYRALALFEESSLVTRVDFRKDAVFFEMDKVHHHHISCVRCDTVEDFKSSEIENFFDAIVRRSSKFINLKDHSLELFGVCRFCSK